MKEVGVNARPLRVGMNATSLLSPLTGVGYYTYSLCRALEARSDCEVHYFYGYRWSRNLGAQSRATLTATRNVVRLGAPILRPLVDLVQQISFSRGVVQRKFDVYHEPNFIPFRFGGPVVSTIHDLSVLRYPETHPADRRRYMGTRLNLAVRDSQRIIAVSEFVKKDIVSEFPYAGSRVDIVHNGVSSNFAPMKRARLQSMLEAYGLKERGYFLCVGAIEPRKNLPRVVMAYSALPWEVQSRCSLVVVGGTGWKVADSMSGFRELQRAGHLIMTGYVEEEKLVALYSGACALLYPSLYEGFGLPVLEAMACGAPVVTSNKSSLPEIAGGSALLIDPEDVDALSATMLRVWRNPTERERLIDAGRKRASSFSWSRCADETMKVYHEAILRR